MRTSVFVGTSLDGFLARPDGSFDFLTTGSDADGEANGFNAFFSTVDAVLLGRNTYDVVLRFPAWFYGSTPVFVLSTRSFPPPPSGAVVEPVSGEPAHVLAGLSARGFRHIYVDGGLTIQQFLRAGLIQHLVVTRVPVLIGSGIPLFGAIDADIRLQHVSTRVLAGGAVQSEYEVGPQASSVGNTSATPSGSSAFE